MDLSRGTSIVPIMSSFERETIPDFLVERLRDLEDELLRDVATYARDPRGRTPDTVPDNIANPLYMQDTQVCEAVAEYAERLAEGEIEAEDDDVDDDDGGDDDDPEFMMGPAFG